MIEYAAPAAEQDLSAHARLEQAWRDRLQQVADLSVRLYDEEMTPRGVDETLAAERELLEEQVAVARHALVEIEAALQRLAEGRYGDCENCSQPIPEARLQVRPDARRCVPCQVRHDG